MLCLGFESTAHTFGVSVVDSSGKVLSNVRDTFTTEEGGMILSEVMEHHEQVKEELLEKALLEAKLSLKDIDLIALSNAPGLAPALLVGKKMAKNLASSFDIPLVGVNHCVAHLEIGLLMGSLKDPVFVFTSGANTQVIAYEAEKYRIFGEALSVGLGNALDKFGRAIGLGFPAGPKIEELAKKGKYIELPYVVKGMDVEFSGIVTNCIDKFKQGVSKEDLCFSLQEVGFAMLTEVSERALAHTGKNELLVIGGVGANQRLCEMMETMCKERGAIFSSCPLPYVGDNAAMIAWTGILKYRAEKKNELEELDINPSQRTDDVEISWKS